MTGGPVLPYADTREEMTMKKKKIAKLALDRETLRRLQDSALAEAAGAVWSRFDTCTGYTYCTPCIDP
jgi:hypothetical protein